MTKAFSQLTTKLEQCPKKGAESTGIQPESTNSDVLSAQEGNLSSQYTESTTPAYSEQVLSASTKILGLRRTAAKKSGKSSLTFWLAPADLKKVLEFMRKAQIDWSLPGVKDARRILNLRVDKSPAARALKVTSQPDLHVDNSSVTLKPADSPLPDLHVDMKQRWGGNTSAGCALDIVRLPTAEIKNLVPINGAVSSKTDGEEEDEIAKPNIQDADTAPPTSEKNVTFPKTRRGKIPDPNQQDFLL